MIHVVTAVLGLAPSGPLHHALAFEGATLAAVGAARRITEPHEAQFRRDRAVVLRGIHSCGLSPLQKLGDPQPSEMDGVDAEMRIAAALVSRLLGAEKRVRYPSLVDNLAAGVKKKKAIQDEAVVKVLGV